MGNETTPNLFDGTEEVIPARTWEEEWNGMPEFNQRDETSEYQVIVHFATREDRDAFAKLVEQKITYKTRSLWYPKAEIGRMMNKVFINDTAKEDEK